MEYEDYFQECWSLISADTISKEKFNANEDLLMDLTYEFFRMNQFSGTLSPSMAARIISKTFESIKIYGLR